MSIHIPKLRFVALVAITALMLACLAAGVARTRMSSAPARAAALAEARSRWDTRSFSHYRLVLQAPSWCRMDAEIKDEQIVKVYENSCPGGVKTVTDLFDFALQLDRQPNLIYCAAGGCECVEQRIALIEYDPQFGFPRAIRVRRQRAANMNGLWAYMLERGLPNCLTPRDTGVVNVLSLKPLS